MSDIVERLLGHPGQWKSVTEQFRNMVEQRHEAAAEIEQLRQERKNCPPASESEYVRRLEAENERLRFIATKAHTVRQYYNAHETLADEVKDRMYLEELEFLLAEVARLWKLVDGAIKVLAHHGHEELAEAYRHALEQKP